MSELPTPVPERAVAESTAFWNRELHFDFKKLFGSLIKLTAAATLDRWDQVAVAAADGVQAFRCHTDLCAADLQGAILQHVDPQGAHLQDARLSGAFYNDRTRWPLGFDPDQAGARRTDQAGHQPQGCSGCRPLPNFTHRAFGDRKVAEGLVPVGYG